jgi:hypothetical protein
VDYNPTADPTDPAAAGELNGGDHSTPGKADFDPSAGIVTAAPMVD